MTFDEIIQKIRAKDEVVTECFFYWDGPSIRRIEEVRRRDPIAASRMPRPVCNSCRPALLSVLHSVYGESAFDYKSKVDELYAYIMDGDKLSSIKTPDALMGWMVKTSFTFFLSEKKREDRLLENSSIDTLNIEDGCIVEDDSRAQARELVEEVLAVMPNRVYARILEDVVLEVEQYKGRKKSELLKRKAEELGISIDNLYVKISLAKRQFRRTAEELKLV